MRAFLAILSAIGGAVGGYVLAAFLGILLIPSSPGDSGGTAMGIFFGLAPMAALICAFGALIWYLRASRSEPAAPAANSPDDMWAETEIVEGKDRAAPAGRRPGLQALIAFAVVVALAVAIYRMFFYQYSPPGFPAGQAPVIQFEIAIPTAAIDESDGFALRAELRSWQHLFSPQGPVERRPEGDETIVSGTFRMVNRLAERAIWLYPSRKTFVEFKLPYVADPPAESGFGEWRTADKIEIYPGDPVPYPLDEPQAKLRTRIVRP